MAMTDLLFVKHGLVMQCHFLKNNFGYSAFCQQQDRVVTSLGNVNYLFACQPPFPIVIIKTPFFIELEGTPVRTKPELALYLLYHSDLWGGKFVVDFSQGFKGSPIQFLITVFCPQYYFTTLSQNLETGQIRAGKNLFCRQILNTEQVQSHRCQHQKTLGGRGIFDFQYPFPS